MIQVEQIGPITAIRMARGFLGKPLAYSTAYWLDGLLIDTGPACAAPDLVRVLKPVGVQQIALTHCHEETIGGLAAVRTAYPGAKVYASAYALTTLADPTRLQLQWYRRLAWGLPAPMKGAIALDEVGNVLTTPDFQLRAVETPGHTQDHVSYFEPYRRWAFCGDAFIPADLRTWPQDADLFGVMSSLRTLADLRPERLFPANGGIRRTPLPDLHDRIGLLARLARAVARLEAQGLSTPQIVEQLLHGEPRAPGWTEGHLTAANLVDALRSYNALTEPLSDPTASAPGGAAGNDPRQESPEDSGSGPDSSRAY